MKINSLDFPQTGDVVYSKVPGMGLRKKRPCIVIAGMKNQLFLLPLSSSSWKVSANPIICFRGNISFVILDKAFTVSFGNKFSSNYRVSELAIATCFESLTQVILSGS